MRICLAADRLVRRLIPSIPVVAVCIPICKRDESDDRGMGKPPTADTCYLHAYYVVLYISIYYVFKEARNCPFLQLPSSPVHCHHSEKEKLVVATFP